ncbi:unnamed protein product [Medioppia subpectinata]|uniref:Carboxypeptidase n=1 Tax=Medioppia subpectinata TaxID=1979941 RepID=A0A7R9KR85_9ACAR|nr:unnamed protein product [Medioppia subpectinata]CAG2108325.1 unnamed protein product [Medioppia subpectinata]
MGPGSDVISSSFTANAINTFRHSVDKVTTFMQSGYCVNEDEITSLPGLSDPIKFKQYSGYLNASKGRHHFYWFTESESDPQNAPVVLWLSGGPGCSSICGAFIENGPFRANDDGKTLSLNNFAGNKAVNMVYMESPVSTGFSYEENTLKPHNNDTTAANDNYLALESFFAKYPHLKKNPFYITGESYAEVYIPMLALEIFKRKSTINLKGISVGNGLGDDRYYQSQADFFLAHGLVTTDWYDKKISACCESQPGIQHECDFNRAPNKTKCESVPNAKILLRNPYNIYSDCTVDTSVRSVFDRHYRPHFEMRGIDIVVKCPVNGHTPYLNVASVQQALHVRDAPVKWGCCDGLYDRPQDQPPPSQVGHILELILEYKLGRIVVYNGDLDSLGDVVTGQRFVDGVAALTDSKKLGTYHEWTEDGRLDGRIGGYAQHYENGLSFVLVRHAGHMVPGDQPEAALQVLKELTGITKL